MFSNLFHMELIRYCKTKSMVISVGLALLTTVLGYVTLASRFFFLISEESGVEAGLYSVQALTVHIATSSLALFLSISVVVSTTSFFKYRFYYNTYGVIRNRFKLFVADTMVFGVLAFAAAILIMFFSYLFFNSRDGSWVFLGRESSLVFGFLFVFCRVFFNLIFAFMLTHLFRRVSAVLVSGIILQLFQSAVSIVADGYIEESYTDNGAPQVFQGIVTCILAPSQAMLNYACEGLHGMNSVMILATTSIPFVIIFIVAALVAGRRIEV